MKITENDVILRTIVSLILPFSLMLSLFVILNGHISPGGGFSGGVIFGASLILHDFAFGSESTQKIFNFNTITILICLALLTYVGLKAYSFMTGAAHIETNIPLGEPGAILSGGFILPLNICVGIIVSLSMYMFFALFNKGEV